MKLVKRLLLGGAAGILAVAGAQAADLPVKAKPVEYVKVCSLYGAGFYYMPGTDICIKIGGYIRVQAWSEGNATNGTANTFQGKAQFANRTASNANDFMFRARGLATFDTRQQTEYGTLRSNFVVGFTEDTGVGTASAPSLYASRAFIQLGGWTFGKADSLYNIMRNPAISYFGLPGSDTGESGISQITYTQRLDNGFSATVALEDPSRLPIYSTATNPATATAANAFDKFILGTSTSTNNYGNVTVPDIVGILRVDQAWGSALVAGTAHLVSADYYGGSSSANLVTNGHPDDKWGWAVNAGVILNADVISRGDQFQLVAQYTEGVTKRLNNLQAGNYAKYQGSDIALGLMADAVMYGANDRTSGAGMELTKGWNVQGSYEHLWNAKWKTSVYGGIIAVDYSDKANLWICGGNAYNRGCTADWSTWFAGSRTQFNINSSTLIGFDVMYTKLNTAWEGGSVVLAAAGGNPAGTYTLKNAENLAGTIRLQRDFLP